MTLPREDGEWLELIRAGMPPLWSLMAEGAGGTVWAERGVVASILPRVADRSVFNSVFYEDGTRLIETLEEIAAAYDEAGVRAWTVWVPEADTEVAAALEAAGHTNDAQPRAMAMATADLRKPDPDPSVEFRDELDMAEVGRLNEIAYGWAPGTFEVFSDARVPNTYGHLAGLGGETVGCVMAWDDRDDAQIVWVATLPEARGRGIATALMARAVEAAAQRGRLTTTLVATALGAPVYTKVGYRDFGALQMWERRKPA
jgi:ribosomal protein S18 acetylase RimI-like enzyme